MVERPTELGPGVRWWPSTLWQTTTLELIRNGRRLLLDPGIAPWEIADPAGDGVDCVLLTHGDWDHVLGVGALPEAEVVASRATAERLAAPETVAEVEREAGVFYVPVTGLERLRVDRPVDAPAEVELAGGTVSFIPIPGHTDDSTAVLFADEAVLAVGDYLSAHEAPFVYGSIAAYCETLTRLSALIEAERPAFVVPGHGAAHAADAALAIAAEDLAYLDAVLAFAAGRNPPERAGDLPLPARVGRGDPDEHATLVRRACDEFFERS